MPELTTVPSFVFYQGQAWDENYERPIEVKYYDGEIELVQHGDYEEPDRIIIKGENVKSLLKEILKHAPEANKELNK